MRNDVERQLNQHIAQAQAIYLLADAVARSGIDEVYGKALDAIELALKVDRVSLLLFDPDGVMRFKAWRGLSDEYRAAVEGHSPWTKDAKDPEPITVRDIEIEPGYEELRPVIAAEGIRSLAFVPLVNQGGLLGKFMLYYNTPHDFSAEEVRLAQTIASHIAFAINRKHGEEALVERAALAAYTAEVATALTQADTLKDMLERCTEATVQHLDAAFARIWILNEAEGVLELQASAGMYRHTDGAHGRIAVGQYKIGLIAQERLPHLTNSVTDDPRVSDQDWAKREGMVSFAGYPLVSGSRLVGVIGLFSRRHLTAAVLEAFESVSHGIATGIQRRQGERALTESELRYRTIFESAGVSLWEEDFSAAGKMLKDLRARGVKDLRAYFDRHPEFVEEAIAAVTILDVNEHSVRLFGAESKDKLMHSLGDIFLPETREVFQEELLTLDRGDRFLESETVLRALDGRRLNVLFTISFPEEPSSLNHVMVSVTDITARKREEEDQQFLAEAGSILTSSLDYETTLDNVARLVAGRLGDLCSIDLVEGNDVRRVALAHVDPAKEALFLGMEPAYRARSDRHPLLRVTRTGRSVLINGMSDETLRDSARDAGHLKALKALKIESVMIVPLAVGSRALGAITIVSADPGRKYSQQDMVLAEELSRRAGIAIDNAELYRARETAREAAQSAAARTTRLQSVTAALSEAVTPSEVAGVVAQAAVSALEARSAFIAALSDDDALEVLAAQGVNPDFVQAWSSYSDKAPASIVEGIRAGVPVFASSREELVAQFPALASLPIVDRSFAGVPLIVEGRAVGSMVLTFGVERVLDTEDRELVLALGRLCAQALERSRLYDEAEDARWKAEATGRRQRFLAEASAILASSLDHETTLSSVAQLCVPELADWCVIDVRNEDGSFNRVASIHRDPAKVEFAREMQELYPPDYEQGIVSQVVKTGKAVLYTEVPEEVLAESARDEKHLELVRELGVKSGIMVPLTARGRTLGILTLLISESEHRYGERELKLAEELGQRAGLALDNARLYSAEQASRSEAEEAQRRLGFLAEASAVLSSSLDFETTLSRVAALALPGLADCCVAHLLPAEGVAHRAAVCHLDAAKEALVHELHSRYAPRPGDPHPVVQMIESGSPVLLADIEKSALEEIIQDERHREILQQLDFKSYMAVPLIARGRLFGALTFATANPARRYTQEDLSLAEELARRAALALDNARLYEESQLTQDALRAALEAKDEFLGVMSHELRTPITAIYGGARVLRSRAGRLDEESKNRLMEDMEQESERLFRMVENLLVLSRLELGQEVVTEPVLVQRHVGKLAAAFQQRRPGRSLRVNISESLEPVSAEPNYLEQVLRNLLSNADKYSPLESPIEVEATARNGEVEISILDRGPGIEAEEIELIFDRFYRSDRTATQAAGIGLGLTVCKRLAEAQAGRIWVRSRDGGGLRVGITLAICKEE